MFEALWKNYQYEGNIRHVEKKPCYYLAEYFYAKKNYSVKCYEKSNINYLHQVYGKFSAGAWLT